MAAASPAPARTWRAIVFAALTVILGLALRARSDGAAPAILMTLASVATVALAARPLTSRERPLAVIFGCLVGVQLVLHTLFLYLSTGHFAHAGSTGLFCSPSMPAVGAGSVSCGTTDRGGAALLGLQLVAALVAAGWLRGLDRTVWVIAAAVSRRMAAKALRCLSTVLNAFIAMPAPEMSWWAPPATEPGRRPLSVVLARAHGRRGPPAWSVHQTIRPSTGVAPAFS